MAIVESTTPENEAHNKLRIKVCGMKFAENIANVATLEPDFLGFIFVSGSARYAADTLDPRQLLALPLGIKRVGVFVDETTANILRIAGQYGLDLVQLHGEETPEQCADLQTAGLPVMKVFSVGETFDFATLMPYVSHCTYFLFDTKGEMRGGNGTTFDWNLLKAYPLSVPYFLAGGLDLSHVPVLQELQLPGLFAVDLNSRFEAAPGQKDVEKLRVMLEALRYNPMN
ncbi:phosphoribosylanthranilate isomerase [Hymenobacter cavernae]|uniref:N-(5'-phosphoribosyl)anthranilate isomerase n=1 Tax=Hymenobacter cavernae TaxID=2044852 RepID=A0ABQ1U8Q3_9BACT|nr:phosphoribosylanthranilate isomerase [Hymenobacter cavernae]GGF13359.1 N-(5'-phosphoribosyl)anthranilate isomerase [Hymenobacter cavernae]